MANIGRGAYEPPGDDVRIFDGSEDEDGAEGSRLPLLIVIALFVLAAFGGVVWLAYIQGVARGHSDVPRIIAAQKGPAKVAANGQGNETPYKGLKIYEQPAPTDEESNRQALPPAKAGSPAAPETTLITPHETPAPPPPGDVSLSKELAPPVAKSIAPPVMKPPALAPALKPAEQRALQAEASAPPAELDLKTPPAAAASGGYVVQIGAFKSQAEADAAWKTYRSRHAATLSSYAQDVKMVDLGAKGTWYRLRVGSFADKNAAAALCAKLTAEGGACFPAK
jgi:cell division septation protein DedD